MLVLLNLSTAFDTVDHNILIQRLENWVKLSGMVHIWFRSYLEGRGYYASIGEHKSQWTSMTCGVPHGSILGPLLFSLFLLPLSEIMRKNQIAYHSYADDTQIYLALSPNDYSPIDSLCQCIDDTSLPALLPFGRSCYCSALCSLFLFFSQISLRFLLQQISTVLKQQFFWKKRTFCLPLPADYIPETDKYSCLHSNR